MSVDDIPDMSHRASTTIDILLALYCLKENPNNSKKYVVPG